VFTFLEGDFNGDQKMDIIAAENLMCCLMKQHTMPATAACCLVAKQVK
jgi:hypothetical protein